MEGQGQKDMRYVNEAKEEKERLKGWGEEEKKEGVVGWTPPLFGGGVVL